MTKFRLETYLLIYIYINGYNFVIYFKKKLLPFNKLFIVILYSYTTGNALISVHNLLFRYLYYNKHKLYNFKLRKKIAFF